MAAAIISILIPNRYDSTVNCAARQLRKFRDGDDRQPGGESRLRGSARRRVGGGPAGLEEHGRLFVGVLESRTVADRIIDTFDLRKVYWRKTYYDARKKLSSRTDIEEDKKSGLISITVSATDPKRAAAMAQAYVDELDRLVSEVTTSSARRERIFLEERLKAVHDLLQDDARQFSEVSSQHTAIDLKEQGKAMVSPQPPCRADDRGAIRIERTGTDLYPRQYSRASIAGAHRAIAVPTGETGGNVFAAGR